MMEEERVEDGHDGVMEAGDDGMMKGGHDGR